MAQQQAIDLAGDWRTWPAEAKLALLVRLRERGTPWPAGWLPRQDGKAYRHDQALALQEFHESSARFRLLSGGRGSGKTSAGAQEALRRIRAGQPGAVLNPDFENFKYSTWPEFKEWLPWDYVLPKDQRMGAPDWEPHRPFTIHFDTGSRVVCKGLKDADSARGPNINWLWYDEGGRDRDGLAWKIAIASVRVGDSPAAWCTTTPRGKGHWTYRWFVEEDLPDDAQALLAEAGFEGPLFEHFRITIHDNQANLDPLFYASMLAAYTGWLRDQEIEGLFVEGFGTLAQRSWFKIINAAPVGLRWYRFWDLATTEKQLSRPENRDPDYTAGGKIARARDGRWFLDDVVAGQWGWLEAKKVIKQTAKRDGRRIPIGVEAVAGFKVAAAELQADRELAGYTVKGYNVVKDKVARANPWLAQAEAGNFYLIRGPWNKGFLDEVEQFPLGNHDDRVDMTSGGVEMVVGGISTALPDQRKLVKKQEWD